ncbi:protein methyltransferase [Microthyrium microscopicum]|uniref:Protein methyltransferase n=1 Tax=Microthyrium microscopicum TaxID=703497 RepID=A0A6A6URN2_9PEZI|nr:protein methyltransferase [Microthyrium microscopicum]
MTESAQDQIPLRRACHVVLRLNTPKGRGVFAERDIVAGEVIETCPVLILSPEENKTYIEKTELYHYTYNWPDYLADGTQTMTQAIVFGLGSMFNHSNNQNVGWERNVEQMIITYRAVRDIPRGEELCISYGSRLTFIDSDRREATPEGDGIEQLNQIELDSN